MAIYSKAEKIHGQQNPGGYDYEAYAYQNGIRAQGYIVKNQAQLLSYHWYHYPVNQLREKLYTIITTQLPISTTSQWIHALSIGERQHISPADWEVLRNTVQIT